jgi:hypothetical protein
MPGKHPRIIMRQQVLWSTWLNYSTTMMNLPPESDGLVDTYYWNHPPDLLRRALMFLAHLNGATWHPSCMWGICAIGLTEVLLDDWIGSSPLGLTFASICTRCLWSTIIQDSLILKWTTGCHRRRKCIGQELLDGEGQEPITSFVTSKQWFISLMCYISVTLKALWIKCPRELVYMLQLMM